MNRKVPAVKNKSNIGMMMPRNDQVNPMSMTMILKC
jgi:hypothetical protein